MSTIDNSSVTVLPSFGFCELCAECVALPDSDFCADCQDELGVTRADDFNEVVVPARPSFSCQPCDCGANEECLICGRRV